eukprot:SAG22_NODE_1312_length_4776_cov_2.886466_1_plen_59_part_00
MLEVKFESSFSAPLVPFSRSSIRNWSWALRPARSRIVKSRLPGRSSGRGGTSTSIRLS